MKSEVPVNSDTTATAPGILRAPFPHHQVGLALEIVQTNRYPARPKPAPLPKRLDEREQIAPRLGQAVRGVGGCVPDHPGTLEPFETP